jgi:hypothetical protein
MAAAPPSTALVVASSIRLRFSTNGQGDLHSKAPASIAGDADVKATHSTTSAMTSLVVVRGAPTAKGTCS